MESDSKNQEIIQTSSWPVFTVTDSVGKSREMKVFVLLDGKFVEMEVDTGAAVSIMPDNVWGS